MRPRRVLSGLKYPSKYVNSKWAKQAFAIMLIFEEGKPLSFDVRKNLIFLGDIFWCKI